MRLINEFIADLETSALGQFSSHDPWELTSDAIAIVEQLLVQLGQDYSINAKIAVHNSATIERAATIKGPAIIGPDCFIATNAYIRGGGWLESNCVLGPGVELKSSFLFSGTKLAHFNFVGDSILGRDVNLEAGAIIANSRNEQGTTAIALTHRGKRIATGVNKFGALIGDGTKIGANAVVAPGALIAPGTIIDRLALVDQAPYGAHL
jgi:UDP-N-acetylglucosamine diphosphorylase / glucose-1-phosphate thymidylyltransferase / UDP-N-acetylgalactosamine diphosphorylase / glucosamine-1-phosphate N-acetyltransferase / galactosamine-1-phosphate N-acetyltransferase